MRHRVLIAGIGLVASAAALAAADAERPKAIRARVDDGPAFREPRLERERNHTQPRSPRKSFKKSSKR